VNLSQIHRVFFVGIGGIGMSALARYFQFKGLNVVGYDRTPTELTHNLTKEGIAVHFEDNLDNIPDEFLTIENTLIVYTPAIPSDHKQLNFFKEKKYNLLKRAAVLGEITRTEKTIAVAGTHGKTTVSTMISHLLHQSTVGCNAFVGGISKNYQSNLILSENADFTVVEADEFDRSFLQLFPNIAVITATDADHLDIYGEKENLLNSFKDFSKQINKNGFLFVKKELAFHFEQTTAQKVYTYHLRNEADFYAKNITQRKNTYSFDLHTPFGEISNLSLGMPGLVNLENAVVAIGVALISGVKELEFRKSLSEFQGIKRRFDYRIDTEDLVFIDDYAHHPEELRAVISSVKEIYTAKKITGIFQPHLFTRTRDFVEGFAESLDLLDEIILLDIYPAREKPIEGVTSEIIFEKIKNRNKFLCKKEELLDFLKTRNIEVLLSLGAGDIDKLVQPIENSLK